MKKPIEEVVGENIRRHRNAAGWSQKKLSEKAGVSQRVISNLEQGGGAGSSSIGTLEAVADALGIPVFLIMTEGLVTDRPKIDRMAAVISAFGCLSDHAQQRIVELIGDYTKMSQG